MPRSALTELRLRLEREGWLPLSRLSRLGAASLVVVLLLWAAQRYSPAAAQSGAFITAYNAMLLLAAVTLLAVGYRWLTRKVMWRLRNRLIVTYMLIGVIPLVLLSGIFLLTAYLFVGQFATFIVSNDLHHELHRLGSANRVLASSLAEELKRDPLALSRPRAGNLPEFAGRQVLAAYRGKTYLLESSKEAFRDQPLPQPAWKSAIVLEEVPTPENVLLYLRAVASRPVQNEDDRLTVLSSVPLDQTHLKDIAADIGVVGLYIRLQPADQSAAPGQSGAAGSSGAEKTALIQAGTAAPAKNIFDRDFIPPEYLPSYQLDVVRWTGNAPFNVVLQVTTRPSLLYARLLKTLGEENNIVGVALVGASIILALIELVALIVGIRLTRSMTSSVAGLYDATQRVNQGDLSHRIRITRSDQLAALEHSFNSMTENLERLIVERQEKQRIESELNIAKEVQDLLFPEDLTAPNAIEIHGVCRPARSVSGDYYDFLPIGPQTFGLAVGDISGKGISAALMMATVHAFVRAYTLVEHVPALAAAKGHDGHVRGMTVDALRDGIVTPGHLLTLLNEQIYRSTPAEKYATMFLGFYDSPTRRFHYSNAGHLPPIVVSANGRVEHLSVGGTVVGLFGSTHYPDGHVQLRSGDIVVAYSDGVTEPENEFGEFGVERLVELVQSNRDLPLPRISEIVLTAVSDWIGGAELPDDCTVVLARAA